MQQETKVGPLTQRFNLMDFTDNLIEDLQELRDGKISIRDAMARATLAKQVLKSVHYAVTAQKYLADSARMIGKSEPETTIVEETP